MTRRRDRSAGSSGGESSIAGRRSATAPPPAHALDCAGRCRSHLNFTVRGRAPSIMS
jgi:hypothetical protein